MGEWTCLQALDAYCLGHVFGPGLAWPRDFGGLGAGGLMN